MSNRKARRRAAAARRHAPALTKADRGHLVSRVGVVLAAIVAVIAFFAISQMGR